MEKKVVNQINENKNFNELITLKCCNVFEMFSQIKSNSIDLIVTDPPYNSKLIEWDCKDNTFQMRWLKESKRVLKDGGSFYCFFAPMNMYEVEGWIRKELTLKNLIVWHHSNLYGSGMSYGKDRYKSTWDAVFYAVKGSKAKHGKNVSSESYIKTGRGFDVMIYPQPRPLLHKAQKPLELIRKFIICSSNENDVVLDPFVGSGTTVIACKQLNRKFIGCDDNEKFISIANRRLCNIENLKNVDKEIWKELKEKKEGEIINGKESSKSN